MLEFIIELAELAGKESLRYFGNLTSADIEGKMTDKDLVSIADKAVENTIISKITETFPEHDIFGEETGHAGKSSEYCWVIDPIDGTQSFVKNHPYYSISIALYQNGKPLAGAVCAPALGKLFYAQIGKGAFENGKPIHVSDCPSLHEAACATGFSLLRQNKVEPVVAKFARILPLMRDIKRCGSAALDSAFTAAGIYDGFWEEGLQLYDIAAGAIIAREAGATVCDFKGKDNYPADGIIVGTPAVAAELLKQLAD